MINRHLCLFAAAACLFSAGRTFAQFSPGELASAHAHLEGLDNCTQCHELGKKIDGNKCMDCHNLIRARVNAGRGFHASSSVRGKECVTCHIDHKGRDFDMVKWEGGRDRFDHDRAGYTLDGKHKTVDCRDCHKPERVKDKAVIARVNEGLSLKRTYLGLSADCGSCHFDEHRAQFSQPCSDCHTAEDWKQSAAAKFDHDRARFRLTGRHAEVSCQSCHKPVSDVRKKPDGSTDADYMRFRGLKFDRCIACHVDPHEGRFGTNCEKCHIPGGWKNVKISGFDHSKTGFPLTGLHLGVACEKCHKPNPKKRSVYKGLSHERCRDCHTDWHLGQLDRRKDAGACESCHHTAGFSPSLFTLAMHNQQSRYLLDGAHVTIPCVSCHVKSARDEFTARTGLDRKPDTATVVLRFASQRCLDCHSDAHHGQFTERIKKDGCEGCHRVDAWNLLAFDHDRDSRFALRGKHKSLACVRCHAEVFRSGGREYRKYKPLSMLCESCHKDVHFGQFVKHGSSTESQVACDACHTEGGFKPVLFNHNTQSRFALTGAHEKTPCSACHKAVVLNNGMSVVVYKPIDTKCSTCHANTK
jgi:hypothetical protein